MCVSYLVFAVEVACIGSYSDGDLDAFVPGLILVLVVGFLPAAVIGSLGALVVAAFARYEPSQAWHVVLAAVLGTAAGVALFRSEVSFVIALTLAAACGRWVLVPRVRARRDHT